MTKIFTLTWKDQSGLIHTRTFKSEHDRYEAIVRICLNHPHTIYQASTEYVE